MLCETRHHLALEGLVTAIENGSRHVDAELERALVERRTCQKLLRLGVHPADAPGRVRSQDQGFDQLVGAGALATKLGDGGQRIASDSGLGALFLGGAELECPFATLDGLRFVATDLDWSYGDGPTIEGGGEAIMMSILGRPTLS